MEKFKFTISPEQNEEMVRRSLLSELEFVSAFIDQQNGQLNKYLGEFNCENEKSEAHGFLYDEERDDLKVSGLSSSEYDLNGVFREELPEYIMQSQMVILWAMLERSLSAIIKELYSLRGLSTPKKGKHESYFFHLIKCLEDIYGENKNIKNEVIFLNENVRIVRNYIVHRGCELNISHSWLTINNGVLQKIHHEYIGEILFSINQLGNNI